MTKPYADRVLLARANQYESSRIKPAQYIFLKISEIEKERSPSNTAHGCDCFSFCAGLILAGSFVNGENGIFSNAIPLFKIIYKIEWCFWEKENF